MCVNPTDVFAAGVSTATTTTTSAAAGNDGDLATLVTGNISGSDVCCKDVVINSGFGRRRSSGARSLVSLPPGMIVDSDVDAGAEGEEDILMDEINWDKLL